jgi:hypothetical protein
MTVAEIKRKPANDTPDHEEFASLYEALRAAQATLPDVAKNRTAKVKGKSKSGNEFEYSYKYADITDVLSAVRPHFARFGITILQPTRIEGNALQVATRIVHDKTGQFEESLYPVAAIGADHQALGSALTYARRYALCSMIGLAPDEDADGQHAAASGPERQKVRNEATGRMVDPNSSAQLKKNGAWDSFMDKLQHFQDARDFDGLKAWYGSEEVQVRIARWPEAWRVSADEEYGRVHDALEGA